MFAGPLFSRATFSAGVAIAGRLLPAGLLGLQGARLLRTLLRIEERLVCALENAASHVCDVLLERRTLACSRETQVERSDPLPPFRQEEIDGDVVVSPLFASTRKLREMQEECLCVSEETSIGQVVQMLQTQKRTCALVMRGYAPLGVFELDDVLRYVLRDDAMDTAVGRAVRPCRVVSEDDSMSLACDHLRDGLRHVVVASGAGEYFLVSQRGLAAALLEAAESARSSSPNENVLGNKAVFTAPQEWTARAAFERMAAYGVTSLPIIESGGRAVGVISATDVLHGTEDLDLRVREFVALSRRAAGISREPHCIVKCAPHDGVLDALRLMMHEEVRHVYVLDAVDTPVGVFSLVDALHTAELYAAQL